MSLVVSWASIRTPLPLTASPHEGDLFASWARRDLLLSVKGCGNAVRPACAQARVRTAAHLDTASGGYVERVAEGEEGVRGEGHLRVSGANTRIYVKGQDSKREGTRMATVKSSASMKLALLVGTASLFGASFRRLERE